MAQLKHTTIQGTLKVDLTPDKTNTNKKDGIVVVSDNGTTNFYNEASAVLRPLAPLRMDLGTQNRPWLRTHTRAIKFYASNTAAEADGVTINPHPVLAGCIYTIDEDTNNYYLSNNYNQEKRIRLQLGNPFDRDPHISGEILMYGENQGKVLLKPPATGNNVTITFPKESGTIALSKDIPNTKFINLVSSKDAQFNARTKDCKLEFKYTGTDDKEYIGYVNVVFTLSNCGLWGSEDLDIFTIRGYGSMSFQIEYGKNKGNKVKIKSIKKDGKDMQIDKVYTSVTVQTLTGKNWGSGDQIWIGSLQSNHEANTHILPQAIIPLSMYRKISGAAWQGAINKQTKDKNYSTLYVKPGKDLYVNVADDSKKLIYGFFFSGMYSRLADHDFDFDLETSIDEWEEQA